MNIALGPTTSALNPLIYLLDKALGPRLEAINTRHLGPNDRTRIVDR